MAAPPVTGNCTVIGMAFDYLARFWLKRRHPDAEERAWVAELAIHRMEVTGDPQDVDAVRKARAVLAAAKSEYIAYMSTGTRTTSLMRAALGLATLDPIYYRNLMKPRQAASATAHVGAKPKESDVIDLRALWRVMEGGDLRRLMAPILLNPGFGDASALVGGGDADIIADGFLVEIKTTKSPTFRRRYFDQLAGYAVLQRLAGGPDFRGIGVYFSRHGRLEMVDADRVYGAPKLGDLLSVFPSMSKWMFGDGRKSDTQRTGSGTQKGNSGRHGYRNR